MDRPSRFNASRMILQKRNRLLPLYRYHQYCGFQFIRFLDCSARLLYNPCANHCPCVDSCWLLECICIITFAGMDTMFFVLRWTQRGIERLPEFMDIVKAGSPSANAMEFNTVIGLDLPVGQAFAGGKYYLGTRLNVATEGTGAKDGVEKSPFYGR